MQNLLQHGRMPVVTEPKFGALPRLRSIEMQPPKPGNPALYNYIVLLPTLRKLLERGQLRPLPNGLRVA